MYTFYNKSGCFTIYNEIERDLEFYSSQNLHNLCEKCAPVFTISPQVWKKHSKIGPFPNPFFMWSQEKFAKTMAEAIKVHLQTNDEFFGIKVEKGLKITPDIEVVFEFFGVRKSGVYNGYRPAHLINNDYLSTGVHHYYDTESVSPNGTAKGTITFLSPDEYPNCLWIGKKIPIQEGERVVGSATITKIFNPILEKQE